LQELIEEFGEEGEGYAEGIFLIGYHHST